MINFSCNDAAYLNDLMELVRAFEQRTDEDVALSLSYSRLPGEFRAVKVCHLSIVFSYILSHYFC